MVSNENTFEFEGRLIETYADIYRVIGRDISNDVDELVSLLNEHQYKTVEIEVNND